MCLLEPFNESAEEIPGLMKLRGSMLLFSSNGIMGCCTLTRALLPGFKSLGRALQQQTTAMIQLARTGLCTWRTVNDMPPASLIICLQDRL